MHVNSKLIFREHVVPRLPQHGRILEIGPDGDPSTYQREANITSGWDTADLDGAPRVVAGRSHLAMVSEYEIPAPDDTYDVVLSGQVAEHVREIWTWMRELARVVKPGGQVITIRSRGSTTKHPSTAGACTPPPWKL